MYKRDIYLDIDDELNNYIKSVELDSDSRVWHFHLTVDYEPLDLTGKSVQFRAEKPDKTNVLNDCKIVDAEKGVVEVKLTRQVNAIPGHVKCLLKIVGDEGFVLKTKTFVVEVSKTLSDDAIVSSDEFGALEAALGKVQDIDNRFAQTNARLSNMRFANVKDFGATGDGVTDDTSSISGAITHALQNDLVIYFPYGIYKVLNLTINNANNFQIISDGGTLLLSEKTTAWSNALLIENSNNFTVDGLNINGNIYNVEGDINNPNDTPQSSRNMQLINCTNFTLKNMHSYDRAREAFSLEGCRDGEIFNCRIINTDVGVIMSPLENSSITCENITINNCYMEAGTSEGVSLWYTKDRTLPNKNIVIKNCIFNSKSDNSHSIFAYNGEEVTIMNNVFKNSLDVAFGGIDIGNVYAKNIYVKNNLFENVADSSLINIQKNSSKVHITENTIFNSGRSRYINVEGEDIVIKNNNFHGFKVDNPDNLLLLSSCDKVLIEGNNFDGYTQSINDGIVIQDTAKNVSIYRNIFPTTVEKSIHILHNQTNEIGNCRIIDNVTNTISSERVKTGDDIRYRGNMFNSNSNSITTSDDYFSISYEGADFIEVNIQNPSPCTLNPTKGVYPVDGTLVTLRVTNGTMTVRTLSEKGAYCAKNQRDISEGETISFIFANDMFNEI